MAIFTICSKNYLPRATVLIDSIAKYLRDVPIYIFLSDLNAPGFELDNCKNILTIDNVLTDACEINRLASKYNLTELNTAIKPFCFNYLFRRNYKYAIYLDPDIELFGSMLEVFDGLELNDAVVTPHLLSPYFDEKRPSEIEILSSGTYNFGFLALKNSISSNRFVEWWGKMLLEYCYSDIPNGLFVDQKFGEFATSFIDSTLVLKHPGYNVAYWNLHERNLEAIGTKYLVNKESLQFFHYSGVPEDVRYVSKHQNRHFVEKGSIVYSMLENYSRRISEFEQGFSRELSPDFRKFDNGATVLDLHRTALRIADTSLEVGPNGTLTFQAGAFFKKKKLLLKMSTRHEIELYCEPIIAAALYLRPDVLNYVSLEPGRYPHSLREWFESTGYIEFGLSQKDLKFGDDSTVRDTHFRKQLLIGSQRAIPTSIKKMVPVGLKRHVKHALRFGYRFGKTQHHASDQYQEILNDFILRRNFFQKEHLIRNNISVNYIGYLDYVSGLGVASRSMAHAFMELGIFRSAEKIDIPDKKPLNKTEFPEQQIKDSNINFYHVNLDQLESVLIHRRSDRDKINIAYPVWELPTFPKEWLAALFAIDDVLVPSNFVADNMLAAWGFRPTVLPHPISVESSAPEEIYKLRQKLDLTDRDIIILMSFDLDSYFQRKNPIGALRAIKAALSQSDVSRPIKTVVKLHGTDHEKSISKIREFDLAGITIVDEVLTSREYEALQEVTDIYVSLHRSEGFGLNIAEMMARGKIVVTTRYSGNLDYCTDGNSLLVDYRLVPVRSGEYPHHTGGWWAEPAIEDAAKKLFHAIKMVEEGDLRLAARAKSDLSQGFCSEVVAKQFIQFLNDKVERLHAQRTIT